MIYEWDPEKAASNPKKHRVSFREAASVLSDPSSTHDAVEEVRTEYDVPSLKAPVRGKFRFRTKGGTTLVLLDRDVAQALPSETAVDGALRSFLRIGRSG